MSGNPRILPRFFRRQEELDSQRKLAKILLESGEPAPERVVFDTSAAGDSVSLRGIPAIARGVAGVSPGTDPFAEALRAESRAEKRAKS